MGLRRHVRARGLERERPAARDPDLRCLESAPDRDGARAGAQRDAGYPGVLRRRVRQGAPCVKAVGARGGKSRWRRAVAIHLLFAPECLVVPGLVPAGEPEGNTLADEVRVCATLGSDSERLLCYDRLAATLAPGADAGPAREAAPVSAQRMFGLRRSAPEQPPAGSAHAVRLDRSEEHTSELQSRLHLVCRLLLEKKKQTI